MAEELPSIADLAAITEGAFRLYVVLEFRHLREDAQEALAVASESREQARQLRDRVVSLERWRYGIAGGITVALVLPPILVAVLTR